MVRCRSFPIFAAAAASVALACASAPAVRSVPAAAPPPARPAAADPAPPAPVDSGLSLAVEPADAELVIDGRSLGKVTDLGGGVVPLPPGLYQVSLRRAGFSTWRAEVGVHAGLEPIRVTLARRSATP